MRFAQAHNLAKSLAAALAMLLGVSLGAWVGATASADQDDPALAVLFAQLRNAPPSLAAPISNEILSRWATAQSDTTNLLFARAVMSLDQGAYARAMVLLDDIVVLSPSFVGAYTLRAQVFEASGDLRAARADYEQAVALEPRHFMAWSALGRLAEQANELERAHDAYQQALNWNPQDARAQRRARDLRRKLAGQEI